MANLYVDEFYALAEADVFLICELIGEMSLAEREAREPEVVELCQPVTEDYTSRLKALVSEAQERHSIRFLQTLPAEARALDAECDAKLRALGITGSHEAVTDDGRRFRVPEYLEAVAEALRQGLLMAEPLGYG